MTATERGPKKIPRVLFVDTDPRTGDSLCSFLDGEVPWEVEHAETPDEAVAVLAERYVDAVVCDLATPEKDGVPFLLAARQASPHTVRLAAAAVEDAAAWSADAHRILRAPLSREVLVEALEAAADIGRTVPAPDLVRAIGLMSSMPMAASAHRDLMTLLSDPEVPEADVVELVETDPGTASRVLQLANASEAARTTAFLSVEPAVRHLGHPALCAIVLESEVGPARVAGRDRRLFSTERLREHARLSAHIASLLVVGTGERAEVATTAALLQHAGRQAYSLHCKHESTEITRRLRDDEDPVELEREVLGCSQGTLGSTLLRTWGLPPAICDAVRTFEAPGLPVRDFEAPHAVHVASALAAQALGADDPSFLCFGPPLDPGAFETWGFTDSLDAWSRTALGLLGAA